MLIPQQFLAPQQTALTTQQTTFDISSLMNAILPLMMLMMVMGMLMPMMKGMSGSFGGKD